MRKAYLFVYNDEIGSRKQVKEYLDTLPKIVNWRYELPNAFYLISELEADQIANLILKFSGKKGLFIVAELTSNTQGWLQEKTWALINKKLDPDQLAEEFPDN